MLPAIVTVANQGDTYHTTVAARQHQLVVDEPNELGGTDTGPTPGEMLLASLGTCAAMTMRMYARRKQWPLAEVRVRLLPLKGADIAADWAAHKLAAMKKNSVNYSFQAEQDLAELQDGLIEWQSRPGRAKKLFAQDLASWKYETSEAEDELVVKQQEWASRQAAESTTAPAASTSGTAGSSTTSASSEATPTVVISPDRN